MAATGDVDAAVNARPGGRATRTPASSRCCASIEQAFPTTSRAKARSDTVISSLERAQCRQSQGALGRPERAFAGTSTTGDFDFGRCRVEGYGRAADLEQRGRVSLNALRRPRFPRASDGLGASSRPRTASARRYPTRTLLVDQGIGVIDQLQSTLSLSADALGQTDSTCLGHLQADFETVKTDVAAIGVFERAREASSTKATSIREGGRFHDVAHAG